MHGKTVHRLLGVSKRAAVPQNPTMYTDGLRVRRRPIQDTVPHGYRLFFAQAYTPRIQSV